MAKKKGVTGVASGYLHGYSPEEQERLYRQARFLEESVFRTIDFSQQNRILEVGSGVGAQTEILLERFPHITVQGIDASRKQVERAKKRLAKPIREKRVSFIEGDAFHMPFEDNQFDGAFICWLLEHVQNPVGILQETRRVLKANGIIYCNEVLNATFYVHPYSPATLQYWFAFNDHQYSLGGDPYVGAKLANYLLAAGYQNVTTHVVDHHFDNRAPKKRAQFIEYWTSLLLSGAPALLETGRVTPEIVAEMTTELKRLQDDPDAVFFYSWIQAKAQVF